MIETQAGINAWAEETFGPMQDVRHMAARANEELAELLREVTMPLPNLEKIAEECADVAHVLMRIAGWANEDLMPIFELEKLIIPNLIYDPVVMANAHMAFLLQRLSSAALSEKSAIGRIVALITIRLAEICAACGTRLGDAIDAKMVILRARKWDLDGTGCGYHRPEPDFMTRADALREQGYKPNGEPL